MFDLREYQHELIRGARQHFRQGRRAVLIQLATGGGKTATTARMVRNATERDNRVWFCVHRRELVAQVCKALAEEGIQYGLVTSGSKMDLSAQVQVCSIPTLVNRLDRLPMPDVVIFDECHHIAAGNWSVIVKHCHKSRIIGLSATPCRLDGAGLGYPYFEAMVCGPSPKWLIENKYLSDFVLYSPHTVDTSVLGKRGHDYRKDQTEEIMSDPKIVGNIIGHYRENTPNTRALGFWVSRKRSKAMAQKFTEAGYPAVHIDGTTADHIRDHIMRDFESGHIRVLCNVDLFGEGYDCPMLETVILGRPTMSLALAKQQVGRVLRTAPGKLFGSIHDHVGNCDLHGPPDAEITWELTSGSAASKSAAVPSPRVCRKCFAQNRAGAPKCKVCHTPFESGGREIEEVDGVLLAQENARLAKLQEEMFQTQEMAANLDGLIFIAKQRNIADAEGWAKMILANREKKAKRKRA